MGVRTLYSCQGGDGTNDETPYILVMSSDLTWEAVSVILEFWQGYDVFECQLTGERMGFYSPRDRKTHLFMRNDRDLKTWYRQNRSKAL